MEQTDLGQKILAYLVEHPDAQDTLEGIIQWWLLEQEIRFQADRVREELGRLVKEGMVVERKGKDERIWYRLDRTRRHEIEMMLKDD